MQILKTRFLMYLPSRYVPLLLANTGYTPKQAFDILLQVFWDDNVIQEMKLIIMCAYHCMPH